MRPHPRHHRPRPGRDQPPDPLHHPAVLPLPHHRRPGRPRDRGRALHRTPARPPHPARPDLPHPLVQRPIRHADHAQPRHRGGPTSAHNGQGLCESCNHAKEAPGWRHRPVPGDLDQPHTIGITTPTGHHHRSTAPPPPTPAARPPGPRVDIQRPRLALTLAA
ncbi:HNH endonuclease [Nocardioides ungokensis]|uniref:HNH endonuclease n=1 Tax=Nocardioides ungokensis TaxID=1643322 RepID=UPI003CCDEE27